MFKFWTKQFVIYFTLMLFGNAWIYIFSYRLWVNRRARGLVSWLVGCIVIYTFMHHNDTTSKTDAWRKTPEGRHRKTVYLSILFVRFAFERVLETEHKLHILTPLLWPSRCVFLVLLDAQPEVSGSTPSGLFRGPPRSGMAFPTISGLYCLEVYCQLNWVK